MRVKPIFHIIFWTFEHRCTWGLPPRQAKFHKFLICDWGDMVRNVHFFSTRAAKKFFVLRFFLLNFFLMCPQRSLQTYYELTEIVRHTHFTRKISKVQLLLLQTNKNFLLSNFRIFSYKMGVSYNFGQLIICLKTWLRTHEKNFNRKNLKTKKFLAAHIEEKRTFLTISPQP
jgi:hypothetical protein